MAKEKKTIAHHLLAFLRLSTAIAGALVWVYLSSTITGEKLEHQLHDPIIRLQGAKPPPKDVVLVALDEATYEQLGLPMDRPIPRMYHAKMLERLAEMGAKRVVFDIVFAGRSAIPEGDEALSQAVGKLPVVLAVDHGAKQSGGMTLYELVRPDPFLADRAAGLAIVGMQIDDETARHFYVNREENVKDMETLSEAGAGYLTKQARDSAELPDESDLIHYYGPSHTIKTYSLYQILEKEVPLPAELIKDKVVYVGLILRTGLGATQKDAFGTPFGSIFGVEIHATQAANLIEKSWIRRPSRMNEWAVGSAILIVLLLMMLRTRPLISLSLAFGTAGIWLVACYIGLANGFFLAGGTAVTIVIPAIVLTNLTYWYIRTRKQQQKIEAAFSLYLSPAMVAQLKKNPAALKLGGEETICSAIFTDIKGFTTISEQLGALGVTKMLNEYFTEVSQAVMDEGGTVIKFIGDAVFALWGAPVAQEDHAQRACRAALRIQDTVDRFNESNKFPKLTTRVGVNTGKMVVGNLGSLRRFDYTAIGDAVNLAARVEGVNKYLGSTVLLTEDALNAGGNKENFHLLRMGAIKVVGKEIPVGLFRMDQKPFSDELRKEWETALEKFTARQWDDAKGLFEEIQKKCGELETVCDFYKENIEVFRQHPPQAEWRGEVTMDHK